MNNHLLDLITLDIPERTPRERGFLDVVNQTAKETTICSVYRYFLDPELSPLLSKSLIDALLELIYEAYGKNNKKIDLMGYEVHTELGTDQRGRIDIVLDSKTSQSAIIIEAKLYHGLFNDLKDYWNKFKYPENQKAGILLSLESMTPAKIGNTQFINITHSQWLNWVCEKGLPAMLPLRDYVYFNDFVSIMNHLTKSSEMTEDIKFYFKHKQKIAKALEARKAAVDFVHEQLRKIALAFDWEYYREKMGEDWTLWNRKEKYQVYIVVHPDDFLKHENKMKMELEIYDNAKTFEKEIREMLKTPAEEKGFKACIGDSSEYVKRLYGKSYSFNDEDIAHFTKIIEEAIKEDFNPLVEKVNDFLMKKEKLQNTIQVEPTDI